MVRRLLDEDLAIAGECLRWLVASATRQGERSAADDEPAHLRGGGRLLGLQVSLTPPTPWRALCFIILSSSAAPEPALSSCLGARTPIGRSPTSVSTRRRRRIAASPFIRCPFYEEGELDKEIATPEQVDEFLADMAPDLPNIRSSQDLKG